MKKHTLNRVSMQGMSFVELLLVVLIMSILLSVGMAPFQAWRRTGMQNEAKSLLGGYYRFSRMTSIQYGFNPGNLVSVGYNPTGVINYRLIVPDNSTQHVPYGYPDESTCISTGDKSKCSWGTAFEARWEESHTAQTNCKSSTSINADGEYSAVACLAPSNSNSTDDYDEWTINELKILENKEAAESW